MELGDQWNPLGLVPPFAHFRSKTRGRPNPRVSAITRNNHIFLHILTFYTVFRRKITIIDVFGCNLWRKSLLSEIWIIQISKRRGDQTQRIPLIHCFNTIIETYNKVKRKHDRSFNRQRFAWTETSFNESGVISRITTIQYFWIFRIVVVHLRLVCWMR